MIMFINRQDAGKKLAERLVKYRSENCIIYGLPRGGIPVAYEVAQKLGKPLEALIVKKIGLPGQEEVAIGAVTEGTPPSFYFNEGIMGSYGIDKKSVNSIIETKLKEISEIGHLYRGEKTILQDQKAIAIVVDDGIATGATVKASINMLHDSGQSKIVVAVPVCQISVMKEIEAMVDEFVSVDLVRTLYAVGEFYNDFSQVSHETVVQMLQNMELQLKGDQK